MRRHPEVTSDEVSDPPKWPTKCHRTRLDSQTLWGPLCGQWRGGLSGSYR